MISVNMQFLLSLDMFEIIGFELEHDQMSMNQEHMNLILFGNYCDFWYKSWSYDVGRSF